jgi:hypothetical protein
MPDYRFLLTDIMTGRVISDAIAYNLNSYGRQLSNSSDCSGTLDLSDESIRRLTDPIAATEPRRTALWIIRDLAVVWGGIIWTRRYRSGDNNLELSSSTPESYFSRRRIRSTLDYRNPSVDQHEIIRRLVNHAQSIAYGNIGISVPASFPSSGQARDRTYFWHERATYFERMQQLSEVIDGPDFTIAPGWAQGADRPQWYLECGTPLGVTRNSVWEFPGDARNYSWPDDGGNSANFWSAIGDLPENAAEDAVPPIRDAQISAEWQAGVPLLEDASQHQGVIDVRTLAGYASANVKASAGNRHSAEMTLRLLEGYEIPGLGDVIQIRITDPYRFPADPIRGFPGLVARTRVTGWTVYTSEAEGETISLNLTDAEVVTPIAHLSQTS